MFDIDDFKRVNDTYGHVFGDVVLREIAIRTVSILRAEDYLFRWGGEEFLVVLRTCDLVRGRGVAEKIRRIIADPPIHDGEISVGITITIGLSEYAGGSIESMIVRADEALYLGKRSGKNRVVVSDL
jgi:diguanylate cyclase (GGDEF)-like protein